MFPTWLQQQQDPYKHTLTHTVTFTQTHSLQFNRAAHSLAALRRVASASFPWQPANLGSASFSSVRKVMGACLSLQPKLVGGQRAQTNKFISLVGWSALLVGCLAAWLAWLARHNNPHWPDCVQEWPLCASSH